MREYSVAAAGALRVWVHVVCLYPVGEEGVT